jgi:hypothetical protein
MAFLALNLVLQLGMLSWVTLYVLLPSVHTTQDLYLLFHQECFDQDGQFSEERFANFEHQESLCQFPLYDKGFIMSVLFLWCLTCFHEIRSTMRVFDSIMSLPKLPDSADSSDMVTSPGELHSEGVEEEHAELFNLSKDLRGKMQSVRVPELAQTIEGLTRVIEHLDLEYQNQGDETRHLVCLSAPPKIALFFLVLLPRLFIIIVLMTIGCIWLLATNKFENLILNALALEFVVSIDNSLYGMSPRCLQDQVQALVLAPPGDDFMAGNQARNWHDGSASAGTDADIMEQVTGSISGVLSWSPAHGNAKDSVDMSGYVRSARYFIMTVFVVFCVLRFCPVLPSYKYDINMACNSYIHRRMVPAIEPSRLIGCILGLESCFPYGGGTEMSDVT